MEFDRQFRPTNRQTEMLMSPTSIMRYFHLATITLTLWKLHVQDLLGSKLTTPSVYALLSLSLSLIPECLLSLSLSLPSRPSFSLFSFLSSLFSLFPSNRLYHTPSPNLSQSLYLPLFTFRHLYVSFFPFHSIMLRLFLL